MLKDKVAVVTGGSRGIGRAIVKRLASEGCHVAVIYAGNEALAQEVCAECKDAYQVNAISYKCNVADFEEVKTVVAQIKADFGTIDLLVNNAGINRDGLLAMMKETAFDEVIAANLKGTFNMIRQCTPIFMKKKAGRIVNLSSVAGIIGNPGQVNYAASKAGIIGMTKSVAKELASRGITCNAVAPGFIATDMVKELTDDTSSIEKQIPLGRLGKPEEIADAVAFLLNADYVTGVVLQVDGGIAM